MWEERVTLGSGENMLIIESECSMLLLLSAVAGFTGFGRGVGGSWVNVFSVRFSLFYVHFVFSCMHVIFTLYRPTQGSRVLYLSYLVLGWGQVQLFLVDESTIGSVIGLHCHSIT